VDIIHPPPRGCERYFHRADQAAWIEVDPDLAIELKRQTTLNNGRSESFAPRPLDWRAAGFPPF
jgi:hypothetical protein